MMLFQCHFARFHMTGIHLLRLKSTEKTMIPECTYIGVSYN